MYFFLLLRVPEGADAELAVSVQGPVEDIPVKVGIICAGTRIWLTRQGKQYPFRDP